MPASRGKLKIITLLERRSTRTSKKILFLSGITWLPSPRMDLCLIKSCLTSAWTSLSHSHGFSSFFTTLSLPLPLFFIFYLYCSTPPRVYRQTATLMGLQLVTSFISVANTLGSQRETTQRQLNAETKKRPDGPLLDSLNKRLSLTHQHITTLEDMMRKIFTG